MKKRQIGVSLPSSIINEINELINKGYFLNISDFVRYSVLKTLDDIKKSKSL